ncbi:exonuclease domain-containing protein [Defluviitalea saccharophila]|uniref:Exonuclease domain-containing protein n=1 Tax=Defluviitalea saccharophila TaxID=879970 RepID=A0ABZ2Y621_9FIRM
MDFIAIDFETANANYSSACAMGLVAVKDKEIVDTKYFLIQPPSLKFDEENIRIHGITPEDVKDAPLFPEVWEQIKDYFKDNLIMAHNAIFDMSVLKCCLMEYNLEIPKFDYLCSIPFSTPACRGKNVGNSLEDRATYFGIEIENHHNALSDAITCAKLIIACVNSKKCETFQAYRKMYSRFLPVKNFADLTPLKSFKNRYKKIKISEIVATTDSFNKAHIFYDKNIVFTGELQSLDRKEAMQKVVDLGGHVKSSVSSKTDYLVVGIQDKSLVGEDGLSSKEEKALELQRKGHPIKIINEDEFKKLII